MVFDKKQVTLAVADPGFPIEGVGLVGEGVDSYVSKILYVKTKKSGPMGGVHWARPLDPPIPCHEISNIRKKNSPPLSVTRALFMELILTVTVPYVASFVVVVVLRRFPLANINIVVFTTV